MCCFKPLVQLRMRGRNRWWIAWIRAQIFV